MTPNRTNRRLFFFMALGAAIILGTAGLVLGRNHDASDANTNQSVDNGSGRAKPSGTPKALPPQGTPLRTSFAQLYGEASAGSQPAAERLFGEAAACLHVDTIRESLDLLARRHDWLLTSSDYFKAEGDAGTVRQAKLLEEVAQNIQRVQGAAAACQGSDALLANGRIYELAHIAAERGDDAAAACLLTPIFPAPDLSETEANAYREDAFRLGSAAIEHGSWDAVKAMLSTYNPAYPAGYERYLAQQDPAGQLKYTRLLRMGAPDGSPFAQALDQAIAMLASTVGQQADDAARDWARQTYRQSFFYSGPPEPNLASCTQ